MGPGGRLVVRGPRLYRLLQLPRERDGRIRIELAPGTRALRLHVRLIAPRSTSSISRVSRQFPPSSRQAASISPIGRKPAFS